MRTIPYIEIKKRITRLGMENGRAKWLFDPTGLNDGLPFWHDDYLDPNTFYTNRANLRDAVTVAAGMNAIKLSFDGTN